MKILNVEYDFVVIIDCLSEQERRESNDSAILAKYLATEGVNQFYCYCGDKKAVLHLLNILEAESRLGKSFPIVFISHGTRLSLLVKHSNEDIDWEELRPYLTSINKNMNGNLFVLMACCYGFNGYKIDRRDSEEEAAFGIIGPNRGIKPQVSINANEIFFKGLLNNKEVKDAVKDINRFLGEEIYQAIAMQDNKL